MLSDPIQFRVPFDFQDDTIFERLIEGAEITLLLDWDSAAEAEMLGDVWIAQRLLTAIKTTAPALLWSERAIAALKNTPGAAVLLGCAIQIDSARHLMADGTGMTVSRRVSLQQTLASHRLEPNWFDGADSIVFTENLLRGWNRDFYSAPGLLRPREEIERLVNPLIKAKIIGLANEDLVNQWKESLVSVIYELFENTHIHARLSYDGVSIVPDVVRSVVVRLVEVTTGGNPKKMNIGGKTVEALEIAILDSGVGFFGSKLKRPVGEADDLKSEWLNLRLCLDKHIDDEPKEHSHRGVGLYEVLRALHFLKGAIQVRSGRTFGYRSFFPVDIRLQMEPLDSKARPGMPKNKLLDFNDPYRLSPTMNANVRGVVARTLVPLTWS